MESEKILNLGSKCNERAQIIFADAQKRHNTYIRVKDYMINRLLQSDIKATTAMNTLTNDIFMKPDETLEGFGFRIREIVRDGMPDLENQDRFAIHQFLKNIPIKRTAEIMRAGVNNDFNHG